MNCQGILFSLFCKLKNICETFTKTQHIQQDKMGGCRCIFRDCHINSSSYPGMHFFHFPVKQKEKLNLWIKYAKADHILSLTPSQMKNKVVCNTHFRDECFMNYKKDRLTREAVPTLIRLGQPNMVLDFEHSDDPIPTRLPVTTAKHLLPPGGTVTDKQDEFFLDSLDAAGEYYLKQDQLSSTTIENSTDNSSITEKYFSIIALGKESDQEEHFLEESVDEPKRQSIKVINKNSSDSEPSAAKKFKKMITTPKILNRGPSPTIHSITAKLRSPKGKKKMILLNATQTPKIYKNPKKIQEKCNTSIQRTTNSSPNSSPTIIDIQELIDEPIYISKSKMVIEKENNDNQICWDKEKSEYEKKIQELEDKLKAKDDEISKVTQIETVSTSKQAVQSVPIQIVQPKQLTKFQLFSGIKKYLCPSMSALVRMEMFSEPERTWKSDEKQAAIELLQLGDTVFEYFRDEWRFRLPPKKDVEQWMSANTNIDDEDYL